MLGTATATPMLAVKDLDRARSFYTDVIGAKAVLLVGVVFWVRFSFPRFREDQLQRLAWKFLIPITLANLVLTAVFKVVV